MFSKGRFFKGCLTSGLCGQGLNIMFFQQILLKFLHLQFSAPLAEGQRAIVMALCPSCIGHSSVRACVCVRKLFLQKTSPQKLLTVFLRNFTGMFLRWSSFKFLQIILFYEEFWLPWQSK